MKRREEGYMGKRMMEMAVPGRRKKKGQGEGEWIWQEKTWKGFELRRETKSIGTNGKYFCTVTTSNSEKPKEKFLNFKRTCVREHIFSP